MGLLAKDGQCIELVNTIKAVNGVGRGWNTSKPSKRIFHPRNSRKGNTNFIIWWMDPLYICQPLRKTIRNNRKSRKQRWKWAMNSMAQNQNNIAKILLDILGNWNWMGRNTTAMFRRLMVFLTERRRSNSMSRIKQPYPNWGNSWREITTMMNNIYRN